ncbi:MAG TPA: aspartate/glutamate racemase family protein, partial [Candidatus Acidoferrum sp.]|nr:aspartate/glutamate racemase family protein [Candidatus Acidoferrum sp.]
ATVRSQAYSKAILARCETASVFTRACPLLVPLVEEGWTDHDITARVLKEYLKPLLKERIDTLVLGCTHYPLLKPALRKVLGDRVALVDSADSCARDVKKRLAALKLIRTNTRRTGTIQPFVTDEVERFDELAQRFLGQNTEPAWKIDLLTA